VFIVEQRYIKYWTFTFAFGSCGNDGSILDLALPVETEFKPSGSGLWSYFGLDDCPMPQSALVCGGVGGLPPGLMGHALLMWSAC